jgi:ABC-type lipoprotein export system ATPase subunit
MELVKGAAEKGGASRFIEKMEKGFETELDPRIVVMANKLEHHPDHPLQAEKKKIRKKSDISGGERQRVVA